MESDAAGEDILNLESHSIERGKSRVCEGDRDLSRSKKWEKWHGVRGEQSRRDIDKKRQGAGEV